MGSAPTKMKISFSAYVVTRQDMYYTINTATGEITTQQHHLGYRQSIGTKYKTEGFKGRLSEIISQTAQEARDGEHLCRGLTCSA